MFEVIGGCVSDGGLPLGLETQAPVAVGGSGDDVSYLFGRGAAVGFHSQIGRTVSSTVWAAARPMKKERAKMAAVGSTFPVKTFLVKTFFVKRFRGIFPAVILGKWLFSG